MGKKTKIGKQRKDKYYHLAKEAGYRSRAAFKLIQLNKRFEFLQNSRALVDLCAAPGGWLQVASQNMPISSVRIGVDLVTIKPIKNCITLQGDITTDKTRHEIKKSLQSWEADCVLHDGAPNVGMNWTHDAFQQNCLTLSALKLATQILRKNGYFVTKVFRSNDYHSLITVFDKLFKKVHVWKPAASRLESAEIFVVCEKYLKPDKVNPELLDIKKVFTQPDDEKNVNPQLMLLTKTNKKEKKPRALGYDDDTLTLYHELKVSDFLNSSDYLLKLSKTSSIILDDEKIANSPHTTDEIRECIQDIKVCGPRELRNILAWRKKLLADINKEKKAATSTNENVVEIEEDPEEAERRELEEIDQQISVAKADEKAKLKKKKKKMLKEKAKLQQRKQLNMIHEEDGGMVPEDLELFSLKNLQKMLERQQNRTKLASEKEENLEELQYPSGDEDENVEDEGVWETRKDDDDESDEKGDESGTEDTGIVEDEEGLFEQNILKDEEEITTGRKPETAASRSDKWFSRKEITDLLDDEDDEEEEELNAIEKHMNRTVNKKKLHKNTVTFEDEIERKKEKRSKEDDEFETKAAFDEEIDVYRSDEENDEDDKRVAKRKLEDDNDEKPVKAAKKRKLTPQELAMGELMIYSSKTRSELEDWAWNRYTNNDENLPDWFVDDEKRHCKKEPPISKDRIEFYKNRLRELNTRPIKKVAEAKMRKKKKQIKRLEKAKTKATNILENENMEHHEKIKEMKKLYRKAATPEKRKVTYQVMTKGKRGSIPRPNGHYKLVDKRLRSDNRKKQAAGKKGKSRGGNRGRGPPNRGNGPPNRGNGPSNRGRGHSRT